MSALIPYEALEVFEGHNRVDGTVFFVRDTEVGNLWHRVEYVERRLTCWCDDGFAHAETPDTEPECAHLRAVVDQRMAQNTSSRPARPINVGSFVE
jgi:hypothetical protein